MLHAPAVALFARARRSPIWRQVPTLAPRPTPGQPVHDSLGRGVVLGAVQARQQRAQARLPQQRGQPAAAGGAALGPARAACARAGLGNECARQSRGAARSSMHSTQERRWRRPHAIRTPQSADGRSDRARRARTQQLCDARDARRRAARRVGGARVAREVHEPGGAGRRGGGGRFARQRSSAQLCTAAGVRWGAQQRRPAVSHGPQPSPPQPVQQLRLPHVVGQRRQLAVGGQAAAAGGRPQRALLEDPLGLRGQRGWRVRVGLARVVRGSGDDSRARSPH